MSINFQEVQATLTQTEAEVTEHEASVAALATAKQALVDAQDVVSLAQAAVTTATETEGNEKADVVAGIAQAIEQLNAILTSLQT